MTSVSRFWRAAALLMLVAFCGVAETQKDTARLADHLRAVQGKNMLSAAEYGSLQMEYLNWIDTRLRASHSTDSMNGELKAVGLFADWLPDEDVFFGSLAGYLEPLSTRRVRGAGDLLVIKAGIYKGAFCSLDDTAILYQGAPLHRLTHFNAGPDYAYRLSGLDAGEKDAAGRRLLGSGWTASNCTSSWNGKRIRVDRLSGNSLENLFARALAAKSRYLEDDISVRAQSDGVTFWYEGGLGDLTLLSGPAVARYRLAGDHLVRDLPVALTRAGFMHEWLEMDDAEVVRWSDAQAVKVHAEVASAFQNQVFGWARVAQCGGSPPVWEVGVRIDELKRQYVFQIRGSRATELRMSAISDRWTPSCTPIDIENSLASVASELPW